MNHKHLCFCPFEGKHFRLHRYGDRVKGWRREQRMRRRRKRAIFIEWRRSATLRLEILASLIIIITQASVFFSIAAIARLRHSLIIRRSWKHTHTYTHIHARTQSTARPEERVRNKSNRNFLEQNIILHIKLMCVSALFFPVVSTAITLAWQMPCTECRGCSVGQPAISILLDSECVGCMLCARTMIPYSTRLGCIVCVCLCASFA